MLHELLRLELIGRASEQGWAWWNAAGLGLGLPARAAVEGMAADVEEDARRRVLTTTIITRIP